MLRGITEVGEPGLCHPQKLRGCLTKNFRCTEVFQWMTLFNFTGKARKLVIEVLAERPVIDIVTCMQYIP